VGLFRSLCSLVVGALALLAVAVSGRDANRDAVSVAAQASAARSSPTWPSPASQPKFRPGVHFREVAASAGLDYRWTIPGKHPLNILQTIGNGCAFLDYDGDGNLDILLVGLKLALYRGDGMGHFTDATRSAGLDRLRGHFLGCAVGDYDNDGYEDVYISGYRTGILLHNEGGKHFTDVTATVGLKPQPWGTSCGFADLDGDGYLDLVVANYVEFDRTELQLCSEGGVLTGCGPRDYEARYGVVYRNEGRRGFRNVTRSWRADFRGKGLGVAFADYDGSGRVGFAVANDLMPGDLFQNGGQSGGRLRNVGESSGVALDPEGNTHAGMGTDWGDYDNDGKIDLFVTTFGKETKCLYRNEGDGLFTYASEAAGIDPSTLPYVGWGCKFIDADNDGWLDLVVANGHVQDNIRRFEKAANYRQPTLFLRNRGRSPASFEDGTAAAGLAQLPPIIGRGVAAGDYDNDGRVDVLVVDSEGKPLLLHNESSKPNHWLGFRLVGTGRQSNRDGYGAVITVITGGRKYVRQCHPGGSYLSSSDPRVHVGLGAAAAPEKVAVSWPDGTTQTLTRVQADRYYTIVEKSGEREERAPGGWVARR
jgi:hypothetical protein